MLNPRVSYCCIGKGLCGSVWTLEGSQDDVGTVIKCEDGGPGRSVTNDYDMHTRVLQSALLYPPTTPLSIPKCHDLIQPTDAWWASSLHQFPFGYSACRALISERIPKVPRQISNKIVDLFCASNPPLSEFVKSNPDDEACLIRPYLGRRRYGVQQATTTSSSQRFSLRNVPFHVDQMELFGLDINAYAETMADALALMHWGAGIDANDVEFVLAPPRGFEPPHSHGFQSEYLGKHCMWILDFDCCRPLTMDEAGIEKACAAFFRNDPFYPRPGTGIADDEALWVVFKSRFLATSREILCQVDKNRPLLADMLVKRIEQEGERRRSGNESAPVPPVQCPNQ